MATTNIATLKKASDYSVISYEIFDFHFNEFRGGEFSRTMPAEVLAYGATWKVSLKWIDRGWGDFCFEYYTQDSNSFTELIKEGVSIEGATPEDLANLPINWVELLAGFSGIESRQGGNYSGSAASIVVCDKYITVNATYSRNSCVAMTGWTYDRPLAQFFLDGRDNTAAYLAYCKRKQYQERLQTLLSEGLTKEQATLYLRAKAQWKHENPAKWCFEMVAKQPNKAVWEAIANATGKSHGNKIAAKYGLQGWFDNGSFPRNACAAHLIAQLCTDDTPLDKVRPYPMKGDGWAVIN